MYTYFFLRTTVDSASASWIRNPIYITTFKQTNEPYNKVLTFSCQHHIDLHLSGPNITLNMFAGKEDEKSIAESTLQTATGTSTVTSVNDALIDLGVAHGDQDVTVGFERQVLKPMNDKYVSIALWVLLVLQFFCVVLSFHFAWAEIRLINYDDKSTIMDLYTTKITKDTLELYCKERLYDVVLLTIAVGGIAPCYRFILCAVVTYTHTKYFGSPDDWPICSTEEAERIVKEEDEHLLMPWWEGVDVTKDWFSTRESSMKIGTIFFDLLVSTAKICFTLCIISVLIANAVSIRFLDTDGETFVAEINNKLIGGFVAFHYSNLITSVTIVLILFQKIYWFRSYKERAMRMVADNREESKVPVESAYESAATTSLTEPLLPSSSEQLYNTSNVFEEPSKLDFKLAALWFVSLSCYIALACGIDLVEVNYSGKWSEGMEFDDRKSSFYELTEGYYNHPYQTNTTIRYIIFCDWVLLVFVLPTLTLITVGYLVFSKLSNILYNEDTYNKVFRVLRALFPCSLHDPHFFVMCIFLVELERVCDPILNDTDDCREDKCLIVKSKITPGLWVMGIFVISTNLIYQTLVKNYNHVIYKLK